MGRYAMDDKARARLEAAITPRGDSSPPRFADSPEFRRRNSSALMLRRFPVASHSAALFSLENALAAIVANAQDLARAGEEAIENAYFKPAFIETGLNGDAINWRYWVHQMPVLSALQAACLMSALEPDLFAGLSGHPGADDPTQNIAKARKIQRLAEAQGKLTASPSAWVEWAKERDISVHTGFLLAVRELQPDDATTKGQAVNATASNEVDKSDECGKGNKKIWDDAKLRALWNESILPGVTQQNLADKYCVSRQRIATLLKEANGKFSALGNSTNNKYLGLTVHRMGG